VAANVGRAVLCTSIIRVFGGAHGVKRPTPPFAYRQGGSPLHAVSVFYGFGEADGATVPTGNTPAPESGAAGEEAGEALAGEGVAPAGAGEVCGAPCVFMSSRRKALLAVLWCAYRTDKAKVSTKNIAASHVVNFTNTLVVCAPKIFSVTPAPNAAPKPSLFGRCIRMTRTISTATSAKSTRQRLIKRFIGRRNISKETRQANAQRSTANLEFQKTSALSVGRLAFLLISSQIASISSRSTSPSFLPRDFSLSSN